MKGMNATTGRAIADLDHLYQSVGKIISTPLASCVKRRPFGSDLFGQVDAPNNGAERTRLYAAIATALMRWEPRLVLTRVQLTSDDGTDSEAYAGKQYVDIEGYTTVSGDAVRARIPLDRGNVA
ncbi:TPA: GPW/gp25 family protein [Burkholderia vietnamiensis]|uniref:GPW/gp25 family protein n=1 Tax=Burkholderia cepacia complex TaxID=87882 RepID=UPI0015944862|nr:MULTISPECIES: GPW/gp25 family protein [Burkholderia cepacia complex]MCA8156173.1 GPW/gp25 family protein [Burkholderia contaminans]MCA8207985.1 GPW/gp25 family protein [Burkholderia vietnamiensis]HDR9098359.1 GPW/gp25 family protein [Burkholderia vietnamiensis]HDR9116994.1 GPW/gp25 family protein [Burkholderia vietnamiensis]HDR9166303.1 GPW/gp25 family protein [Burkholderia vietnamiensis]